MNCASASLWQAQMPISCVSTVRLFGRKPLHPVCLVASCKSSLSYRSIWRAWHCDQGVLGRLPFCGTTKTVDQSEDLLDITQIICSMYMYLSRTRRLLCLLLHLQQEQSGLGAAHCVGLISILCIKSVTAIVQSIYLWLAFAFVVIVLGKAIWGHISH